ncbi:hypothetical protein PIB30_102271 [Stylosanthes scabra]|uniref:Uncharacterized protein n=1 Tax=Stylosanthes scabra TaxID=79078 RepID=A0ABU6WVW8_9FABA|nr:hypothetical protein [Stylosanthes scabra]
MVQHMLSLQGRESKHVGYGPLWTQIFEYLGINLQGYGKISMGEGNLINERTLRQMRRQQEQIPQGVDEVEEEVDRVVQEEQEPPQAHEQGHPQEQASMESLIREMRSMNQNLQDFRVEVRGHYEGFNTRLERMEGQVQGIINYIGIEYMPQDDQNDHDT